MNSDNLLCFNLVFGYHLVLFDVCEEPAMLATLQPTVVGFHMARLRVSIILNTCEVCQQKLCFVIFGKPDWSHCALSHHHALPYLTLKQLSNGQ